MEIKRVSLALAAAIVAAAVVAPRVHTAARAADSVKLSRCLIKGDGDGAGYLLVNVPVEPATSTSSNAAPTVGSIGTSGTYANVFYWLDNHGDLRQHIGHQVEIEGDQKGNVKEGEIKIDRK